MFIFGSYSCILNLEVQKNSNYTKRITVINLSYFNCSEFKMCHCAPSIPVTEIPTDGKRQENYRSKLPWPVSKEGCSETSCCSCSLWCSEGFNIPGVMYSVGFSRGDRQASLLWHGGKATGTRASSSNVNRLSLFQNFIPKLQHLEIRSLELSE